MIHRDPFDRMLVSQAISMGMTILTPDEAIRQYPVLTVWSATRRAALLLASRHPHR